MTVGWVSAVVLVEAVACGWIAGATGPVVWSALLAVPALTGLVLNWAGRRSARVGGSADTGPTSVVERAAGVAPPDPELGAFLDSVNHELRTPLNSILGFSDLLLQHIDGPLSSDRRENLQVIRDAGGQLLSLFDDVTELVALMGGQVARGHHPVDLAALLADAQRQAGLPEAEVAPGEYVCAADAVRIERTLRVLAQHAAAHAAGPEAPVARLRAGATSLRVRWTVPGEAPDVQALRALFTPHGTPAGVPRKTRLDLSIARGVAELHGGGLRARATEAGYVLELRLARGSLGGAG